MEHIFYFFSLFLLIDEIKFLINPLEMTLKTKKFNELKNLNQDLNYKNYSPEYKSELNSRFYMIFILLWLFFGLFTFQWIIFVFLFIFNMVIISPITKKLNYNIYYTVLTYINSLFTFLVVLFIIINKYHLHIHFLK